MNAIVAENLSKTYRVHQKENGFKGALKGLFNRRFELVEAVNNISIYLEYGERVGFLGRNGAGKTTTLKILSGLLYPTSGKVQVLGYIPSERHYDFLRQISFVMGHKTQLIWDLPALDSFAIQKAVYDLDPTTYRRSFEELTELLALAPLLNKPVRNLSLGERMKCELAGALLHQPNVLFLDEPTLGLDVTMQSTLRRFVEDYCERHGATLLLTSHYMADVSALVERVIIIDEGRIIYDGSLESFIADNAPDKLLSIKSRQPLQAGMLETYGKLVNFQPYHAKIRVPRAQSSQVAAQLLEREAIEDLLIEEQSLEELIRDFFDASTKAEVLNA